VSTVLTGNLNGSLIDLDKSSLAVKYLVYPGKSNTPAKAISVNLRCAFGVAAGLFGLWCIGGYVTLAAAESQYIYWNSGTLYFQYVDGRGTTKLNISGAWTPTVDTLYDITAIWDGTTGTNGAKLYVNNSLIVQGTASGAQNTDNRDNNTDIYIGVTASSVNNTRIKVDEFTIWDNVIDPASVTLDSGSGALNGSSRTSPVAAASYDAFNNSALSVGDVRNGVAYTLGGVAYTGTYDPISSVATEVSLIKALALDKA
jgi:hypothetical protein